MLSIWKTKKETNNEIMEQKKPTNAQLQKRIKNAVIHIDRTKDTQSIYFSDKGVRLVVDNDGCVIETGYHRHVYSNITSAGLSRPYLYTKRVVEIALDVATTKRIKTKDGYSFNLLLLELNKKDDKAEYNIVYLYSWFLYCIFQPLYGIGEDEVTTFMLYEDYIHSIARNSTLLEERNEDVTNKQFVEKIIDKMREFTGNLQESVLLHKKSDEEIVSENIEAIQETEQEQAMEAQIK